MKDCLIQGEQKVLKTCRAWVEVGVALETPVKTHVHAPKLLVAGVGFLTLGASNWPGVRAGRSPFPL